MQGIAQKILANPAKYSIQELTQGVQNGIIPAYIGIPLIQEKMQQQKESQAMMAGQGQAQQPPVAQRVMQEASAIDQLPSNLPGQYAAGGIVAFARGGMPTLDRSTLKALLGEDGEESEEDLDELVDVYASPLRLPRATEEGIASLQYTGSEQSSKVGDEPKRTHGEGIQTLTKEVKDPNKLLQHVLFKESRGQRYDKEGKLLTSSKGAQGEMQVMPATARDPGFGIAAARSNDPDEIARVGRDMLSAMLNRYGDPKLAAIAYNWGPGNTDKWLAAGADPSKLPRETQGYIQGLAKGGMVERFQGLGNSLVQLDNADYSSIPGLVAGTEYEDQIRRAKGLPTRAEEAAAQRPRKMPPGAMERMTAPMDFLEIPGMVTGTPFADAMRAAQGNVPAAAPTGAAPSRSIKDVLLQDAADKNASRQNLVDKISGSDYMRQMREVAGAFGTLGKHIVSAPGYGISPYLAGSTPPATPTKTTATTAAPGKAPSSPLASAGVTDADLDAAIQSFEGVTSQAGAPAAAGAAQAPGAAAAPAPSGYDKIMEALASREAGLKSQAEQDKYLALLQAGLGMMGGTSPYAAANIGAGASQGVSTYAALSKLRSDEAKNILSGQLMAERYRGLEDYRKAQQEGLEEYRKSEAERKTAAAEAAAENKRIAALANMEKNAEAQAISIIGQDKLNSWEPAAARMAIDAQKIKLLRDSANYRNTHKKQWGTDPFEGMQGSAGAGPAVGSYDPQTRKYSR